MSEEKYGLLPDPGDLPHWNPHPSRIILYHVVAGPKAPPPGSPVERHALATAIYSLAMDLGDAAIQEAAANYLRKSAQAF